DEGVVAAVVARVVGARRRREAGAEGGAGNRRGPVRAQGDGLGVVVVAAAEERRIGEGTAAEGEVGDEGVGLPVVARVIGAGCGREIGAPGGPGHGGGPTCVYRHAVGEVALDTP